MEQTDLLRYVIGVLEELGAVYMVVGSFSSSAYGEPRMTRDIDVVIQLDQQQVERLCAAFPADEYYVSREAAKEAVERGSQFNVIHPNSGNKVDFMIARDDEWGRSQLSRRQEVPLLPDLDVCVASPEDVIVGKMIYYQEGGSEKHLRDIAGILRITGEEVDRGYIAKWAGELGLSHIWNAILDRLSE